MILNSDASVYWVFVILTVRPNPVEDFHPAYTLTGTNIHHPPWIIPVFNCGNKYNIIVNVAQFSEQKQIMNN